MKCLLLLCCQFLSEQVNALSETNFHFAVSFSDSEDPRSVLRSSPGRETGLLQPAWPFDPTVAPTDDLKAWACSSFKELSVCEFQWCMDLH